MYSKQLIEYSLEKNMSNKRDPGYEAANLYSQIKTSVAYAADMCSGPVQVVSEWLEKNSLAALMAAAHPDTDLHATSYRRVLDPFVAYLQAAGEKQPDTAALSRYQETKQVAEETPNNYLRSKQARYKDSALVRSQVAEASHVTNLVDGILHADVRNWLKGEMLAYTREKALVELFKLTSFPAYCDFVR